MSAMSIPLFGQVAQKTHVITPHSVEKLSTLDKCVLLVLADGQRTAENWFVVDSNRLAAYCAATRKGVLESVARLEKWGAIAVHRAEKRGPSHMNWYRVLSQDLIYREAPRSGNLRLHLNVTSGDQSQSPQVTYPLKISSRGNLKSQAGALDPSPNEVEAGTSDRPDKAKPAGRKKPHRDDEAVEAIEGLLMTKLKQVDPLLAAGIREDCLAANPHITTERILAELTKILLHFQPEEFKRPNGLLRSRMKATARKSYLSALDEAAEIRRRAMMEKKP